jgi:hypothetical protein
MFRTKPTTIATITAKSSKPDNVPINVIVVTTHNQVLKQHVFREREPVKAKVAIDWQIEK